MTHALLAELLSSCQHLINSSALYNVNLSGDVCTQLLLPANSGTLPPLMEDWERRVDWWEICTIITDLILCASLILLTYVVSSGRHLLVARRACWDNRPMCIFAYTYLLLSIAALVVSVVVNVPFSRDHHLNYIIILLVILTIHSKFSKL
jgi:hypothetical protein